MLNITIFTVNNFSENTYLLVDEQTHEAAVVDPGMLFDEERKAFDRFVADNGLKLNQIINTHLHLDHCFGADYVKGRYGAKVLASRADAFLGMSVVEQARRYGIREQIGNVEIDVDLKDGDTVTIGESILKVISVPGHTPGGLALYSEVQKFVLVGDSLFDGSIGRTDLPGGDHVALIRNIKSKLLTLPPDTTVLSGHGEPTTIGKELQTNPYVAARP